MTLSIEANHIRESVNLKLLFVPSPPQKMLGHFGHLIMIQFLCSFIWLPRMCFPWYPNPFLIGGNTSTALRKYEKTAIKGTMESKPEATM